VNSDYVPTPSASLFAGRSGMYGPPALSDRYVVCLLKRGYKWPENSGNSPESAPANGRKRSSDPYGTPATVRIDPRWLTQLILGNPHRCQS